MEINRIFNDAFFNVNKEIDNIHSLLNLYIDDNLKKTKYELRYNYDEFKKFIKNITDKINNIKLMISELNNELNCNMDMKMLFMPKMNSLKEQYKHLLNNILIVKDKIIEYKTMKKISFTRCTFE